MPEACTLYIVRHGATAHNLLDPPRMQGRHIDEPLAEPGREQAAQVAKTLLSADLASVYSSPLRRAMETALAIADAQKLDASPIEGLAEADVGHWEDRAWPEIKQNDTERYHAFRNDPVEYGYPGGENLAEVTERVALAINELAANHLGQTVAIVAHSVVNRLYLGSLLGVPVALRRKIPQDNCSVSIVKWKPNKQRVVTLNAVGQLVR